MKYDNIFPTGILVHDVPVWVAKQVEKLVEERVDKLQRPDDNAPHATDYFEKEKVIDLKYDTPELMSEIDMCVRNYQNKNAMNRYQSLIAGPCGNRIDIAREKCLALTR